MPIITLLHTSFDEAIRSGVENVFRARIPDEPRTALHMLLEGSAIPGIAMRLLSRPLFKDQVQLFYFENR
jgi:hypothetical protein